jgi:hypothetical protein
MISTPWIYQSTEIQITDRQLTAQRWHGNLKNNSFNTGEKRREGIVVHEDIWWRGGIAPQFLTSALYVCE